MFNIKEIKNPDFLKKLSVEELEVLSQQIRDLIIETVSEVGGHLSPNLGTVELTVALLKSLDLPKDVLLWDIGHQAYTQKILTGRAKDFHTLRQYKGISGFLKFREGKYDQMEAGHSSTAVGIGTGYALAGKLLNIKRHVVSIVGDASFANGTTFEAMNYIGSHDSEKTIVILNDNNQSISRAVGALQIKLNQRTQQYVDKESSEINCEDLFKTRSDDNNIFRFFNVDYLGPIWGHNYKQLDKAIEFAKNHKRSIVLHVVTEKGHGVKYAAADHIGLYHGIKKMNKDTGELIGDPTKTTREKILVNALKNEMRRDKNIVASTAAMGHYSGLIGLKKTFGSRIIDVGIQEEEQALLNVGMALSGKKVFMEYMGSFFQRAYDEFLHDFTRMEIPAVFALHHNGIAPASGNTHHVFWDISFLANIPNVILTNPGTTQDICDLMRVAFTIPNNKNSFIIRNSMMLMENDETAKCDIVKPLKFGEWKVHYTPKNIDGYIIAYDSNVENLSLETQKQGKNIAVINALFLKPFDVNMFEHITKTEKPVVVYDDAYYETGLGSILLAHLQRNNLETKNFSIKAIPMVYPHHGTFGELREEMKHDYESFIKNFFSSKK